MGGGKGEKPSALVPTLGGRRGNPVVLSRDLQAVIEDLSGDVGAGSLLRERSDVLEWPTTDPAVAQDIDTREELARHQLVTGPREGPARVSLILLAE